MLEKFSKQARKLHNDVNKTISKLEALDLEQEDFAAKAKKFAERTHEKYFELGYALEQFHPFKNFEKDHTKGDYAVRAPMSNDYMVRKELEELRVGRLYGVKDPAQKKRANERILLHLRIVESFFDSMVAEFAISEEILKHEKFSMTWHMMTKDVPTGCLPGTHDEDFHEPLYKALLKFSKKYNWTAEECGQFLQQVNWTNSKEVRPYKNFVNAYSGRLVEDHTLLGELVRNDNAIQYHLDGGKAALENRKTQLGEDELAVVVRGAKTQVEAKDLKDGDLVVFNSHRSLIENVRIEDDLVWFEYGSNTRKRWYELPEGLALDKLIHVAEPYTIFIRKAEQIEQAVYSGRMGVLGVDKLDEAAKTFQAKREKETSKSS